MQTLEFYNVNEKLPVSESIHDTCGKYYIVLVKGSVQPMIAMYLEDDNCSSDWYTNYATKIIKPVIGWCDLAGIQFMNEFNTY